MRSVFASLAVLGLCGLPGCAASDAPGGAGGTGSGAVSDAVGGDDRGSDAASGSNTASADVQPEADPGPSGAADATGEGGVDTPSTGTGGSGGPVDDPEPLDTDLDGIPDHADLDPADPDFPGTALENTVYAHTAGELFYLGIKTYSLHSVGAFVWPGDGGGHEMTDIAIDGHGQLFGVTFDRLYTCHPQTAVCTTLALLAGEFNGLTMVPHGVLDDERDVLVGVTTEGAWVRLDVSGSQVTSTTLGEYGNGFSSSGDTYSIFGVGTFAAADKFGSADDHLVILDPTNGAVVGVVGAVPGYAKIYGLAGWTERAFAFDADGDVLVIDILDGETTVIIESEHAWWGAGVRTRIPQE